MSIFKPNLDKFSTKFFVAPKNDYEVEVIGFKPRSTEIKNGKNAGNTMYVVDVMTKIIADVSGDKEHADQLLNFNFILDEDPRSFNRVLMFVMACKGIASGSDEGDAEFVETYGELDFSFDPDNLTIGSGYDTLKESRVVVSADIRSSGDKKYQEYKGSRPI